jgi:FSR family fosmidomycin resistance protein-like MFS transporter
MTTTHEDAPFEAGRVLTLSGGHAIHDTYTGFLPSLLPLFIANMALSKTEAGLLSVFQQGPSLLQPFIGHVADRTNLRILVVLAPAVTAVMMSLLGIAPGYVFLALFLAVVGTSSASMHAIGPVMVGKLSGRSLGRGMGFWMVGGELGRTLGPIVIVTGIELLGLRGTPLLMIGGLLASSVLFLLLRGMVVSFPEAGEGLPWREGLRTMGPFILPLAGIILTSAFMLAALTTFLPTYLSEEGANLWLAGAALSILQAAGVVGALAGGAISDRLGQRAVLFGSMLVTPLLMFAFLASGGWVRFPLLILLGFTALTTPPVSMALVQARFPENRALANGIYMALNFILRSVVVVALGIMGDRFGLGFAFGASAVITLLGIPLLLLL